MLNVSELLSPELLNIKPGLGGHNALEIEVIEYLDQLDFYVDELTYHSKLPNPIARLLSTRFDPTSLYIRGRADRIAIHKRLDLIFEWEAKTHERRGAHDIVLEALPLIAHLDNARRGVKCLYIYRDDKITPIHECGFWVHTLPPVKVAMIPNRWNQEMTDWYRSIIEYGLPGVKVIPGVRSGGSGDPFVIIDQLYIEHLPHWQALIMAEIENCQ